jgi:hypothetical protein
MSIASEITRIQGNIADAYTEASAKGATMPATQNRENLASTIATISTGVTPTGSISITSNGTYDVTDKAEAVVNVPTGAPALYREFQLDVNGVLVPNTTTTHIMDFTGMTDVYTYALAYAYQNNTAITGAVDMSDLTTVSGNNACGSMFQSCTGLTSANLSALTTISGNNGCISMFQGCTGLTSADLSALTTISGTNGCGYMFQRCTGLTSADLSALTTISGSNGCAFMFAGCTSLTTVYIGGTTAIDFGTRTNQFTNMFSGCTQNIDVYAPAASQAKIESFSGYPNFGATGTVTWHWRS